MYRTIHFSERPKGWTMIHGESIDTKNIGSDSVRLSVCQEVYKSLLRHGDAQCLPGSIPECKNCLVNK